MASTNRVGCQSLCGGGCEQHLQMYSYNGGNLLQEEQGRPPTQLQGKVFLCILRYQASIPFFMAGKALNINPLSQAVYSENRHF